MVVVEARGSEWLCVMNVERLGIYGGYARGSTRTKKLADLFEHCRQSNRLMRIVACLDAGDGIATGVKTTFGSIILQKTTIFTWFFLIGFDVVLALPVDVCSHGICAHALSFVQRYFFIDTQFQRHKDQRRQSVFLVIHTLCI